MLSEIRELADQARGQDLVLSRPDLVPAVMNLVIKVHSRPVADSAWVSGNMEGMQRQSMERSDLDQLMALNEDYVRSVQRGDVQRFQEILGDDFLASNPDGSLVDKQQFLAQTALPVTITGLAAHDVRVRILGEVAIIHARTSYSTQTGEPRTGRYTDIWAKRDGRWFAVAAHVTR
jgi:ketosteroid isomerase-like protein